MFVHRARGHFRERWRDYFLSAWNPRRNYLATPSSIHRFKVLFLGRDEFSVLVFKELYAASVDLDVWEQLVVTTYPDEMVGRRHRTLFISPLKRFVKSLDSPIQIDTIPASRLNFKHWKPPPPFSGENAAPGVPVSSSHVLITASFGRILSSSTLSFFYPSRRLNVHPSLLPAYRGPAPIQHTLLNGETETGVAVIEMLKKKEGIDSGQIWGMLRAAVPPNETFVHLRGRLGLLGGKLLVQVLRDVLAGKARPKAQHGANIAYPRAPMIRRPDSLIDFETMDASDVSRRHRAIGHQIPLRTKIPSSQEVQLRDISVLVDPDVEGLALPEVGAATYDTRGERLVVRCARDTFVAVARVKQEGKALLAARDWWNGVKGSAWWDGERYVRLGRVA